MNDKSKQELKRKISLEKDFMNHNQGNDLLYGLLINQATFDPNTKQLYLSKYNYNRMRPTFKTFFEGKGVNYLSQNLKKLIDNGLIQEGKINTPTSNNVNCYIFSNPRGRYKFIDKDMISYIVNAHNVCSIRIYTYLLDKYEWKEKEKDVYFFTIKELREALGWADTSRSCDKVIKDNLASFCIEGIIRISKKYEIDENNMPRPFFRLNFIAARREQVSTISQEYREQMKKMSELF